ncbi:hypothetical protein F4604DRAFT_1904922 [Suillus subluteus]|nr:hypothetical protein F4604DRAFT_1904922 [Suillus subluteus]
MIDKKTFSPSHIHAPISTFLTWGYGIPPRCRELRQVSLCVDARVDALGDGDNENKVGLQPNARLVTLEVGNSPVAYVGPLHSSPELTESIPRFLHAMAPRFKSVTDGVWSHGTLENLWQVVSDALWMMVTDEDD